MDRKALPCFIIFAMLIILFLCACACVNSPGTQTPPSTAPPVMSPTVTPAPVNVSTAGSVSPPAVICNCPMEPVAPATTTLAATPGEGPCHCL